MIHRRKNDHNYEVIQIRKGDWNMRKRNKNMKVIHVGKKINIMKSNSQEMRNLTNEKWFTKREEELNTENAKEI